MSKNKKKYSSRIVHVFLLLLILRLVEEFAILNAVNTMSLLTCAGGFFVLLIYLRFINKSLDEIGLLFMPHKVKKGFIMAILLNIIPVLAVYTSEYFILKAQSDSVNFTIYYDDVSRAFSEIGASAYIGWMVAGIFVSAIHAIFYEMTFRGLILTLGQKAYSFKKANLVQSILYTVWFMVPVARVALFNLGTYGIKRILSLAVFMLVYQMIVSLKLGMLYKASGSVWICLFDHVAFAFITDSLHIQQSIGGQTFTDHSTYGRLIAYQAVSLIVAVIYYVIKTKKTKNKQLEEK